MSPLIDCDELQRISFEEKLAELKNEQLKFQEVRSAKAALIIA